ncbi:MAG: FadR/GntR family transcriptional regulator [Stappiaceae bacterium]
MMLDFPIGDRRYLQIAQDLSERINGGEFRTGDRLPPERELAAQLGVSRTTVREALLALEIMRFIEIRVGSGVFVLSENLRDSNRGNLIESDAVGPWEVLEARRLIEGQTAFNAALRIDEATLANIKTSIEQMASAIEDVPRFDAADAEFHALIALGAGNKVLSSYVDHLWQMRQSALWETWYDKTRRIENRQRSIDDHWSIYRALKRRQPDLALTAMHSHLDVLAGRFFELNL